MNITRKVINAAIDALSNDLGSIAIVPGKGYELTATRIPQGIVLTWARTTEEATRGKVTR